MRWGRGSHKVPQAEAEAPSDMTPTCGHWIAAFSYGDHKKLLLWAKCPKHHEERERECGKDETSEWKFIVRRNIAH